MSHGPSPTKRRKILVIDDDLQSVELLREVLSKVYAICTAGDGDEGIRLARSEQPDLILLDLYMPKVSGIEACEAIRAGEATRHIPIIILTGVAEMNPRIRAFLSGADDLIAKPFGTQELLARIQSKIRRIQEREGDRSETVACGNLTLYLERIEATIDGNVVPLSVLEFNLLRYFVENPNRVISRQKILDAIWKDAVVSDRTVDTHMASLRKKLTGFSHQFNTIYSAGYILKK